MNTKLFSAFTAGVLGTSVAAYFISHRHTVTVAPAVTVAAAPPAPVIETPLPPAPDKPPAKKKIARTAPRPVAAEPDQPKPQEIATVISPATPAPAPEPPPAPEPVSAPPSPPIETTPEPRQPRTVTLIDGTLIPVRLSEGLSSQRNQTGDVFTA